MFTISPRARDLLVVFCTVVMVLTFAYLVVIGRDIPDDFARIILLIAGFFFGLPLNIGESRQQSGTPSSVSPRAYGRHPSDLDV